MRTKFFIKIEPVIRTIITIVDIIAVIMMIGAVGTMDYNSEVMQPDSAATIRILIVSIAILIISEAYRIVIDSVKNRGEK